MYIDTNQSDMIINVEENIISDSAVPTAAATPILSSTIADPSIGSKKNPKAKQNNVNFNFADEEVVNDKNEDDRKSKLLNLFENDYDKDSTKIEFQRSNSMHDID